MNKEKLELLGVITISLHISCDKQLISLFHCYFESTVKTQIDLLKYGAAIMLFKSGVQLNSIIQDNFFVVGVTKRVNQINTLNNCYIQASKMG